MEHPSPTLAALAKQSTPRQTGLFPGTEDRVGYWLTPPEVFDPLQAEFSFNFDACPYPRPAGFDGTKEPWGTSTWVNPPFEGKRPGFTAWARKAIAERELGHQSVLIMPVDNWIRLLLEAGAEVRVVGNHDWIDAGTGKRRKASRPSLLFILRTKEGP